jgi:hypothetical protein
MKHTSPKSCPKCQHGKGFNCRQCWPTQYKEQQHEIQHT